MVEYPRDFQEIAHCGGQATFSVQCDAQGIRSVAAGVRHSRPVPAAWVGIYALASNAAPVADFQIGGIGQGFNPPCPPGCFPVFLGSDSQQKWGHQCPGCGSYFRNSSHSTLYPLTCPYCAVVAAPCQFLTDAQRHYVRHYIETFLNAFEQDMEPNTEREIVLDMDAVIIAEEGARRPEFYYAAEAQQTQFTCDKCGEFNDIRGVFGYCAACSWRNNLLTLSTSFARMRDGLNGGQATAIDTVRSAVSEFDACCRNLVTQLAKRVPMKRGRRAEIERLVFHDIDNPAISILKSGFDVDLLRGVEAADHRFVKMMMERRHVYEHNHGVADARYIGQSGDTAWREGDLIRETQANAHRLIGLLARMAQNVQEDFHEIFPLTEWPVNYHRSEQERAVRRR
jgi:hypothetical protein